MSELARVAAALDAAAHAGEACVLATVVRTEGSTYRRIGARLVARPDGVRTGSVSAGCLEADVIARAATILAAGHPEVVTYDARSPDDIVWGFGLGCGGLVEVLLEPLAPDAAAAKAIQLATIAARRARSVVATVIRTPDGQGVGAQVEGIDDTVRAVLRDGRSTTVRREQFDVAYELVVPTVRLGICGAGVDAAPLVAAAKQVGWHVTLIDDRPAMANAERWPTVDRILVAEPNRLNVAVAQADCDAAIIMSHNFERDLEFLSALLSGPTPFIGALGPRRRTEQMLTALGVAADAPERARVHGPVGLDIGAETAEEIAVSIVAEVQAAHAGRTGGQLSQYDGPIHC
jgi:xanthine dehydrogenase accessory factor